VGGGKKNVKVYRRGISDTLTQRALRAERRERGTGSATVTWGASNQGTLMPPDREGKLRTWEAGIWTNMTRDYLKRASVPPAGLRGRIAKKIWGYTLLFVGWIRCEETAGLNGESDGFHSA